MIVNPIKNWFVLIALFFISSCTLFELETEDGDEQENIPTELVIEFPSSISSSEELHELSSILGDSIYNYIRNYIYFAEEANSIVQKTLKRMESVDNQGVPEFTYTGIDGYSKNVVVQENYTKNDTVWDYYMEVYNESFSDIALRFYWKSDTIHQRFIFQPSKLNHSELLNHPNAVFYIDYEETPSPNIDYKLFVGITDLTIPIDTATLLPENSLLPEKIVLSLVKEGNLIKISGASSNPGAEFFDTTFSEGRNWTFFGNADISVNKAVFKLALPKSSIETAENLFTDFPLKKVLVDDIRALNPVGTATLTDNEALLLYSINPTSVETPGYFDSQGYISAGSSVPSGYSSLLNFENMAVFSPKYMQNYSIELGFVHEIEPEE